MSLCKKQKKLYELQNGKEKFEKFNPNPLSRPIKQVIISIDRYYTKGGGEYDVFHSDLR